MQKPNNPYQRSFQQPAIHSPDVRENSAQAVPSSVMILSIISLLFGIISIPLIVTCFLPFITALVAIVSGHIGFNQAKRYHSNSGKALSLMGLVPAYLSALASIGLLVFIFGRPSDSANSNQSWISSNPPSDSPKARLDAAERHVLSSHDGRIGFGNSFSATAIAERFANQIQELERSFFTSNRERIFHISGNQFLTYCELHEGGCLFLVHVPSYRDYKNDVRDALSKLAWITALSETAEVLRPGDQLIVAMKGSILYGDILIGKIPSEDSSDIEPPVFENYRKGAKSDLLNFFARFEPTNADVAKGNLENDSLDQVETAPIEVGTSDHQLLPEVASVDPFQSLRTLEGTDANPADSKTETGNAEEASPLASNNTVKDDAAFQPATRTPTPRIRNTPNRNRITSRATIPSEPLELPRTSKPSENIFKNKISVSRSHVIEDKGWNITSLRFLNDDQWIAYGRLDQSLTIVNVSDGKQLSRLERMNQLSQIKTIVDCSSDGKHLIIGGSSGATAVIEMNEKGKLGKMDLLYRHAGDAEAIAVNSKHLFLLSGGRDGTLAWEPFGSRRASPKILQVLERKILAVHLPTSGSEALATDGRQLIRFSLNSRAVLDSRNLPRSAAMAAAFSPDGTMLVTTSGSDIMEYDVQFASLKQTYKEKGLGVQWCVQYHPTKPWILTGDGGVVHVWDRSTGEKIAELRCDDGQYVQTMAIGKDPSKIAVTQSSAQKPIYIFQLGD